MVQPPAYASSDPSIIGVPKTSSRYRRDVQLAAGYLAEHLRGVELVRPRPMKGGDEAVGGAVDDLRDFQDFLNAPHGDDAKPLPPGLR